MTDTPTPKTVNLEDLENYIVVGVSKDGGTPIVAVSPNLTLPDMGMLVGRLVADLLIQTSGAGTFSAYQTMRSNHAKSNSQCSES